MHKTMGERQNPHKQRFRPEPIGRSAILVTPEVRREEPKIVKKDQGPITFSPSIQKAIRFGKVIGKHMEETIQLQLYREPDSTVEIISLTDDEVAAILETPEAEEGEINDTNRPINPFEMKDFMDSYDHYFDVAIS